MVDGCRLTMLSSIQLSGFVPVGKQSAKAVYSAGSNTVSLPAPASWLAAVGLGPSAEAVVMDGAGGIPMLRLLELLGEPLSGMQPT